MDKTCNAVRNLTAMAMGTDTDYVSVNKNDIMEMMSYVCSIETLNEHLDKALDNLGLTVMVMDKVNMTDSMTDVVKRTHYYMYGDTEVR